MPHFLCTFIGPNFHRACDYARPEEARQIQEMCQFIASGLFHMSIPYCRLRTQGPSPLAHFWYIEFEVITILVLHEFSIHFTISTFDNFGTLYFWILHEISFARVMIGICIFECIMSRVLIHYFCSLGIYNFHSWPMHTSCHCTLISISSFGLKILASQTDHLFRKKINIFILGFYIWIEYVFTDYNDEQFTSWIWDPSAASPSRICISRQSIHAAGNCTNEYWCV